MSSSLQEEGPGQFQAHPHQLRAVDQHPEERGNGLIEQRVAPLLGNIRPACRAEGCEPVEEKRVRFDNALVGQRLQDGKRLLEPALPDQRLRSGSDRIPRQPGPAEVLHPRSRRERKGTGRLRHPGRKGRI